MLLLEQRIAKDGKILGSDILKVDSFLNHQIDVSLLNDIGKEFHRLFANDNVTKILTIEASGIGVACLTAQYFGVPVVFAKKSKTTNISGSFYTAKVASFTHGKTYDVLVSKDYLCENDRVLIIDDFLAKGQAVLGLADLVESAGATVIGAGIVIEKSFQEGPQLIRDRGIRLESLARIKSLSVENGIEFM